MKKRTLIIILLAVLVFSCLALTACHEHEFGEWTVKTSATCTEAGQEQRTCECGEVETRDIPATGHTFSGWTVKTSATCTELGQEVRVCACGKKERRDISIAEHTYVNNVCSVCGDVYYSKGLGYTLSDDETYYIVSGIGTCTDTDVVIPSTYNDLPVTSIGEDAFSYCTSLTNITIPNSVTSIGYAAFMYCESLTSITIPSSVSSIGSAAFMYCYSLTSITIPSSVTNIGEYAFYSCDSLTNITIPSNVTSIGWNAFSSCGSLTSVTFEDPTGWYVTQTQGASSGTSLTLTSATQNATYLRRTYEYYFWYKK